MAQEEAAVAQEEAAAEEAAAAAAAEAVRGGRCANLWGPRRGRAGQVCRGRRGRLSASLSSPALLLVILVD